ncbi:nuclear transport factor 2 family protein [Sedimentitalea arenosa]|nr:nuclear transport factor 2 family protein [Arenibacterium arenosum]
MKPPPKDKNAAGSVTGATGRAKLARAIMEDAMSIREIAEQLVAGCREGRELANLEKLYAPDAVSVEGADMGNGREARGLEAIRAKHDWWESEMEMLDSSIEGPMLHGEDRFAVVFNVKVREKSSGKVTEMSEVGVYHVSDGRIVREEFFY